MKTTFLFAVAFVLSCTGVFSQAKWHISPAAGIAVINNNTRFSTALTVGRYIGNKNRYRVDLWGGYVPRKSENIYSVAALFTLGEIPGIQDRWLTTSSLGIGLQKNEWLKNPDFIIPLKANFGYKLTSNVAVGMDMSTNFNITGWKEKTRMVYYTGLFVSFKF